MEQLAIKAIPVLLAVSVIAAVIWRRRAFVRRIVEQRDNANKELQQFLLQRMEALKQLLATPGMSPDELRLKSNAILAEMETRNVDGHLDEFMADNREHLADELSRRQTG